MQSPVTTHRYRSLFTDFLFLLLILAAGWIPAYYMQTQDLDLGWDQTGPAVLWLTGLSLGPGLVAVLLAAISNRSNKECFGLHLGKPFYLAPAWLLLPLLGTLASAISVFSGFSEWDWFMGALRQNLFQKLPEDAPFQIQNLPPYWAIWLSTLVLGPLFWFIPAWSEELAWRGYLFHRLQQRSIWSIGVLSGLLWWLWRLPLYFSGYAYGERSWLAASIGLVFALETGIILTWLRKASRGILAPTIAHATLFSSALIPITFSDLSNMLWAHLTGIIGLLVLAFFILVGGLSGLFRNTPDT